MVLTETRSPADRAAVLARDFAERAAEHDRDGSFPFENFAALRDAGLLGLTVPREFGGEGAGLVTACRVVEEVARGDASTALVLAMQLIHHAALARNPRWPAAVREQISREAVAGGALVNAMRVEPELGTPARGGLPRATATRTESGWRLSGHKLYATGSPILRYFAVWARTAEEPPEVGTFLVPHDRPGVRIVETWNHLGMRASGSHDLLLENVELPREYAVDVRLPQEWGGADAAAASRARR